MTGYIVKRIVWFIPTLFIVCLVSFILFKLGTGDPIDTLLALRGIEDRGISQTNYEREKKLLISELHLDQPNFYFSLVPDHYPRDWYTYESRYKSNSTNKKGFFLPSLRWYGFDNQFHHWFKGVFKMDFGRSLINGQKVGSKIGSALMWTLFIVIISLFLGVLLSMILGFYSVYKEGTWHESILTFGLYVLYGVPVFWLATILIVFFTTTEYGDWTNLFPSPSVDIADPSRSYIQHIFSNAAQITLPVLCLTLHFLAYLTRQIRTSLAHERSKEYSIVALSKGLTEKQVLWRHNLKNSLVPLVTIITGAIPAGLAGMLVLEVIFNIPGMGRLIYQSILMNDWPVLFPCIVFISIITLVSYLIGDILYAIVNPRIRYT